MLTTLTCDCSNRVNVQKIEGSGGGENMSGNLPGHQGILQSVGQWCGSLFQCQQWYAPAKVSSQHKFLDDVDVYANMFLLLEWHSS